MPLTVTVQKGHDFSSGNVTRAALNAGAVPSVAITGAVGTTELSNGAVTNVKVGDTADIALSKLSGQAANSILVVSDTASAGSGEKQIQALSGKGGALIKEHAASNTVEVTPSDDTIIGSKLLATEDTNVINGLGTALTDVASDDLVMVHDTSVTESGTVMLKKATINSIQKVGTTEYAKSAITATGSSSPYTVTVDLDGSPFQTIQTSASDTFNFVIDNAPSTTVKTVTVVITGPGSGTSTLGFPTGWRWPERTSDAAPASIGTTEVAFLSLTVLGGRWRCDGGICCNSIMLVRNTAFLSIIYTVDGDPIVYTIGLSRGVPGATGYVEGYVYTTAASIQDGNNYTSANVTWQRSTDGGGTFSDISHGSDNTLYFGTSSSYSGSLNIAHTKVTIANLESTDYGLYRIKATGTDGTVYSNTQDFSNPT